jgi:mono/diheme cytochrome c family protein/DNA-binding beta-propeller fold protein YncE
MRGHFCHGFLIAALSGSGGATVVALAATSCNQESASGRVEATSASASAAPVVEERVVAPPSQDRAARPLEALSADGIGGAMVAARLGERRLLLIADSDARALRVVAAESHDELVVTRLRGAPEQVIVAGDGRAYVSLRDRNEVVALEVRDAPELELDEAGSVAVAAEPFGLALTPAGDTLLVTSGWGAQLTAVTIPARQIAFALDVPREPRAVAVTRDGRHALVTHALGAHITKVALAEQVTVPIALGGADYARIALSYKSSYRASDRCVNKKQRSDEFGGSLCPTRDPRVRLLFDRGVVTEILTHERRVAHGFAITWVAEAFLAPAVLTHRGPARQAFYGSEQILPAHEPVVIDLRGDSVRLRVESLVQDLGEPRVERGKVSKQCLLPRAAASDGRRAFVACLGTNRVLAYDGTSFGALSTSFEGAVEVPAGPTGIAVDREKGTLHVWSQFAHTVSSTPLSVFSSGETKLLAVERATPLGDRGRDRGRDLFYASGDGRTSADGRACASCHVDGRDDAMTWPTLRGPRQTPMLAGRLPGTSPFGWDGTAETLGQHVARTFALLNGTGLPRDDNGRGMTGDDLNALIDFLQRLPTPRPPALENALVLRGKELFFASGVGCASCHRDATGTDRSRHDVGSGATLDTPSLRFIAGTAPYFHDGRYGTLRELLEKTQGTMGWATQPTDEDLAALEAYLRIL